MLDTNIELITDFKTRERVRSVINKVLYDDPSSDYETLLNKSGVQPTIIKYDNPTDSILTLKTILYALDNPNDYFEDNPLVNEIMPKRSDTTLKARQTANAITEKTYETINKWLEITFVNGEEAEECLSLRFNKIKERLSELLNNDKILLTTLDQVISFDHGLLGCAWVEGILPAKRALVNAIARVLDRQTLDEKELALSASYLTQHVYKNIVFVCHKPVSVLTNDRGELHNYPGPAVTYRDKFGVYYVRGINFPEQLIKEVSAPGGVNKVFKLQNVEQKAALIQTIGFEKILTEGRGYALLDHMTRHQTSTNYLIDYELYKIDCGGGVFFNTLKVEWWERGEKNTAYLGIPPEVTTCYEAVAWTYGFDNPDDYWNNLQKET